MIKKKKIDFKADQYQATSTAEFQSKTNFAFRFLYMIDEKWIEHMWNKSENFSSLLSAVSLNPLPLRHTAVMVFSFVCVQNTNNNNNKEWTKLQINNFRHMMEVELFLWFQYERRIFTTLWPFLCVFLLVFVLQDFHIHIKCSKDEIVLPKNSIPIWIWWIICE